MYISLVAVEWAEFNANALIINNFYSINCCDL